MKEIDASELPNMTFTLVAFRSPADSVGQVIFPGGESGNHRKCKLLKAVATALAYSTAADVIAIERGSGEDVATVTSSATVGTPVAATIAPAAGTKNQFEVDEEICYNLTTDGNAANATMITATFVTVP